MSTAIWRMQTLTYVIKTFTVRVLSESDCTIENLIKTLLWSSPALCARYSKLIKAVTGFYFAIHEIVHLVLSEMIWLPRLQYGDFNYRVACLLIMCKIVLFYCLLMYN